MRDSHNNDDVSVYSFNWKVNDLYVYFHEHVILLVHKTCDEKIYIDIFRKWQYQHTRTNFSLFLTFTR